MKRYLLIMMLLMVSVVHGQQNYSFNELDSLQKVKEKKVLVFVYANWCNYCKLMDEKVFKTLEIAHLLDEQFYMIRLNAEGQQNINYAKQTFKYKPSLGFHELAITLAGGTKQQLTFPTIYLLSSKNEILYQQAGFINSNSLLKILKYAHEN